MKEKFHSFKRQKGVQYAQQLQHLHRNARMIDDYNDALKLLGSRPVKVKKTVKHKPYSR